MRRLAAALLLAVWPLARSLRTGRQSSLVQVERLVDWNATSKRLATDDCVCCDTDWCGCFGCPDCGAHLGVSGPGIRSGLPGLAGLITDDCLRIGKSNIEGAGEGLFAECALRERQAISRRYIGERRSEEELTREIGKVDHSYVWCPEQTGHEEVVCLDAKHATGPSNPLRYVNGAQEEQCEQLSLEMCQLNHELYFRAVRDVAQGNELVVDYGPSYWGEPQCPEIAADSAGDRLRSDLKRALERKH